jgi:hypothetical protein
MARSWPIGQNPNYYDSPPSIGSFCKGVDHGKRWREPYVGRLFMVESVEETSTVVGDTNCKFSMTFVRLKDVSLPIISQMERTIPFFSFKENFMPSEEIVR